MFDLPQLQRHGLVILPRVVDAADVDRLLAGLEARAAQPAAAAQRSRGKSVYAIRNLLELPDALSLAGSPSIRNLIEPALGRAARAVRGIFFDKTPQANWKVPWHQDLSIAVEQRIDVPGFGPWSVKAGVHHVQPPREVLESMLTVRLHLDDCRMTSGPLKVVLGSHRHGVLRPAEIETLARHGPVIHCEAPRGGAVVMRPLLLHASSAATGAAHRRVVHLEFAAGDLPGGLRWHSGVN